MSRSCRYYHGFSLVELLVVIGIITVVMNMLLPAIQKVRDAGMRTECTNNLRQLGVANHAYHDALGCFPHAQNWIDADADGNLTWADSGSTFYFSLRPYLEQANNDGTKPVRNFLCPNRRNTSAGAKDDYCPASGISGDPTWGTIISWESVGFVLKCTTMSMVTGGDGAANTLLLTHKGLAPKHYYNPIWRPEFDCGWGDVSSQAGSDCCAHYGFYRDRDENYDMYWNGIMFPGDPVGVPCYILFTSPHPGAMPCLFGDGHIAHIGYTKDNSLWTDPMLPPPGVQLVMDLCNFLDGRAVAID